MKCLPLCATTAAVLLAAACSPEAGVPQEEATPLVDSAPVAQGGDRTTIPDKFHGNWDVAGGNCSPGSQMQLMIAADAITYYESAGTVLSVTTIDPYAAQITLAMSGEGESWERVETLRWMDAGARLLTSNGEEILRERCR